MNFQVHSDIFDDVYKQSRPTFEGIIKGRERERPSIYEFIAALKEDTGSLWHLRARVYSRSCGKELNRADLRVFVDACPPFKAMMLGLSVALFDRCIRDEKSRSNYRAAWLDLLAAAYLPVAISSSRMTVASGIR